MKKLGIMGIIILTCVLPQIAYGTDNITIAINDHSINFRDDTGIPFIKESRALVPLRVIVEFLNADV